jgi:hypothetical protein
MEVQLFEAMRKVSGSIPDGLTGIFHFHNSSERTMGQEWTQPLSKWVQGIFCGGNGRWCVGMTILPPSYSDCHEILEPHTSGILRDFQFP